jgi:hypothetical protein
LNGTGAKEAVSQRAEQIRGLISQTTSDYEKEKLQERLAKISGGVAVIKVGGNSILYNYKDHLKSRLARRKIDLSMHSMQLAQLLRKELYLEVEQLF